MKGISKEEMKIYKKGLLDDYAGDEEEWWAIHHKILKLKREKNAGKSGRGKIKADS